MHKKILSLLACSVLISPVAAKFAPVLADGEGGGSYATLLANRYSKGYPDTPVLYAKITHDGRELSFMVNTKDTMNSLRNRLMEAFGISISRKKTMILESGTKEASLDSREQVNEVITRAFGQISGVQTYTIKIKDTSNDHPVEPTEDE